MLKKSELGDISIVAKPVLSEFKEEQNVAIDVTLQNNSKDSIYNVEILTEAPSKDYVQVYGNVICKTAEEVASGDKLYLRAIYGKSKTEDSDRFDGYKIKEVNKVLCIIYLLVYTLLVIAILKFWVTDNKHLNIACLCLVFVLSLGISYIIGDMRLKAKDISIINTYEEYVDVKIAGKNKKVRVLVNYTKDGLFSYIDNNSNGVPDVEEKRDFERDTDGDGLPDYYELYFCGTNPYMLDSKSTGLKDISLRSGGNYYLVGDIGSEVIEDILGGINETVKEVVDIEKESDKTDMKEVKVGGLTIIDRDLIKSYLLRTGTGI